jgi:hypothetical protein
VEKKVTDVTGTEAVTRLRSREEFLKMAGAAGVGAALASNVLVREALGQDVGLDPTDFSFSTVTKFRPFNLLAKNFIRLDDSFEKNTTGNYTILRPGDLEEDNGTVRAGGGELRFDGQDDYYTVLKSNTGEKAPYVTVILEVASLPEGTVYAGLYRDEGDYVHAYYDSDTNTVSLEAAVGGDVKPLGSTQPDEQRLFEAPFRFAFVANENEVTALVGDRSSDIGNFRPIIKKDVTRDENGVPTRLDLRSEDVLQTYKNGFGTRSEAGATIVFDRVRAGYYGEAGVRDPHCIQYADGTPYIKDNKLYFTLTNAGLGFFEKAHWAVWTMDLSDYTKIEQVGNVFWRNEEDPTKVLGHHAGQIILDGAKDRWIVLASSWGDFGPQGGTNTTPAAPPVDILYDELPSSINLLKGVHILTGKKHPVNAVPEPTEGKWDPGLTRIDGSWYLAYVIANDLFSDFQPALAKSPPGADHTEVTFVGTDEEKVATEGPIIQKLGDEWRVLASCGDDEPAKFQGRYPMYTLEMEFDGYLDAPHPTNIPHPMVVPIPIRSRRRKRTKYIMITFNGTQYYIERLGYGTHGDFYVMEGRPILRGYVFPPRKP